MTLAVMTRASLGHTGQPLAGECRASAPSTSLVNLGALVRVRSALLWPNMYTLLLLACSAVLWGGAFAWFAHCLRPTPAATAPVQAAAMNATPEDPMRDYDLIVVGAGPAGLSLAARLAAGAAAVLRFDRQVARASALAAIPPMTGARSR
jgi:hypothetical protein